MQDRHAAERGFILVAIAFLVLMMAGLASGLLIEVRGDQLRVDHQETSLQALEIVELGLARSEMEVYALTDVDGNGLGNVVGTVIDEPYEVTAVQHPTLTNRWTLTAVGSRKLSRRRVEVGIRRRSNASYVDALYSKETLTVNGLTLSDSYDSRLGTYASQVVNVDAFGPYANENGHIGSGGDIVLHGSSIGIRGDAIPGQYSEVLESGTPTVYGDTAPRTQEIILPDPPEADFQDAVASNDNTQMTAVSIGGNGGTVNLGQFYNASRMSVNLTGNKELTMPGGTYFFSDFIIGGSSLVQVTGPVKIYVTGRFDIGGGGLINQGGAPGDVEIIAHPYALPTNHPPTRHEVDIHGGAEWRAAVYAPEVQVAMGGGIDYYGAIVARRITMGGNFEFHYDEALGDLGGLGAVTLERLYWRELSPPAR